MTGERPVCPTCGQPLELVAHRHKTLGAWVPVWKPGPCRNPDCGTSEDRPQTRHPGREPQTSDARPAGQ
ncbi:hypothetical protein HCJ93_21010 [Streptomyces sp. SBST2-5]|uniref:Uncharacterized protein n=1 Tax=Streptomyces composti TaxID=2720025 RepID=A0ABX1AF61_9ACTN|nr:hypothetical protein [Streptomyces composti]NJP52468.1 hypothetical protein [Streptomyces composti]